MKNLTNLELEILEKIKPREEEYRLLFNTYKIIESTISEFFKKNNVDVEVSLQGSISHDTWLSGDRDMDIFLLFPKNTPVEKLRNEYFQLLVKAAENLGRIELRYAEHPYIRLYIDGVEADLVPAYKLDSPEEIKTAVDRTPFHTEYVESKLSKELRDHVRLLKKFMKNIGVYGAEIRVRGFSGYVVELLIITYGGFRETLEAISKWKPPVYINSLGEKRRFREVLKSLKKKYPDSIIYLPDPVDPLRNTTANVSVESLAKLVIATNCYLENPSTIFFEKLETEYKLDELSRLLDNRCILLIEINLKEKLAPDVLWGELRRVSDRMAKVLLNHEFEVIDTSIWSDEERKTYILVEVDECEKKYPKLYIGPEFWIRSRVFDYIGKHLERKSLGPWIRYDGKLLALGKRKYSNVIEVLVNRSWEYMVSPHFRGLNPSVRKVDQKLLERYHLEKGVFEWIASFIVKRPFWMEKCIE